MRRVSTFILGLFIVLAWAGLQFMRFSRLNPMMSEFDADAVAHFSAMASTLQSNILPSDWLVSILHSAVAGQWQTVTRNFIFLLSSALVLINLVILWRIRLTRRDIRIGALPRRLKKKMVTSTAKRSVMSALLSKDFRLMVRDTRFFQSAFLLMIMLLLAPLFTVVDVDNSQETLVFLVPYIPVMILSLIVSSTLARQTLPIERLSFFWILNAPITIRTVVLAKWLRIFSLIAPITLIAVVITALRSGTEQHVFYMLIVHLGLVICGTSAGLANAAFSTQFDWSDPRYMVNPASVYLSLLVVLIIGALSLAIAMIGFILHQQIIAFLVFFLYVFLVLGMSLRAAESRLRKLDWLY
jgi:hypothetical protein